MKICYPFLILLLLTVRIDAQHVVSSSIHEEQSNYYKSLGVLSTEQYDSINGYKPMASVDPKRSVCELDKIVFGWHPYWVGSAYTNYDWNLISDLSYFSYEVNPTTGNASTTHDWATAGVINQALANGVRVNLCVTLFANHATLLGNATATQTLITNLINLVQSRGAHGVNIDFEGIPSSQKTNFTNFMINLSNQMHAAIPGSQVSTVLYAVDWSNVFDIPSLVPFVDLFILMGYEYYYSGSSNAGPSDPLYHFIANSYQYSLSRSITYYLDKGLPEDQFVLGLPYFGRDWAVSSASVPATTTGTGSAKTFKNVKDNSNGFYNTRLFHNASKSPYFTYNDGSSWHQCFSMDGESLKDRLEIVRLRNLAGMGIWALGYDDGYTELWAAIEEKMTNCYTLPCIGTINDMGGPEREYYNNEDYIYTLNPQNGDYPLTLTFTEFSIENAYDFLKIYDGTNINAPLIGSFTGTISPGTIVANSGAATFWFTSDVSTTATGWTMNYNCNLPNDMFPDTILLGTTSGTYLNCNLDYHKFYDSGGENGNYSNDENRVQTFCIRDTSQSVRISFRPNPTADEQLKLSSTASGNDYIFLYNGEDTNANLVGTYTGSTTSAPQPGTFITSNHCLTVKMQTDNNTVNSGFNARLYCSQSPTILPTVFVGGLARTSSFTDNGGAVGNYSNNENYIVTFCPDASAIAGEVIWAEFLGTIGIERNWDYLYVYDGPNSELGRLINVFTGDNTNANLLGTIKASTDNASGCLTFQFFSDISTTASGWEAIISTGLARQPFGSDVCNNVTDITKANTNYAGSTMLATGYPGNPDPNVNITLDALPECSGANSITRLENTIWYTFSTTDALCLQNGLAIHFDNISCQSVTGSASGVQFVLYEISDCGDGSSWGIPIYCADKLLSGQSVELGSLLHAETQYYILIDGFAGQHCNFDLSLGNAESGSCILTSNQTLSTTLPSLTVYPNPTKDYLNFEIHQIKSGSTQIQIFDRLGRAIQKQEIHNQSNNLNHRLDISSLPNGMYLYRIEVENQILTGKFQKVE